ncbi:hypothetical protein V8E54_014036 [Elaphomyces granulatus]
MGGGVGLSVHAPFRIATERTVFAMLETTIGFLVALSSYHASMAKREPILGFRRSPTFQRSQQPGGTAVRVRIQGLRFRERLEIVNKTIAEFSTGLPSHILEALKQETENKEDIKDIILTLPNRTQGHPPPASPGKEMDDFRSVPARQPDTLEAVTILTIPEDQTRLPLLSFVDYPAYPHAHYSLPSEAEIRKFVRDNSISRKQTVNEFFRKWGRKEGVREKVAEVLTTQML